MNRASDYYLDWEFIVLQVEDQLFRIPKYHLIKHSQFFADMLELPQPQPESGKGAEGSNDANPIVVPPDVTTEDFRHFMSVILPLECPWDPSSSYDIRSDPSQFISILKLSTIWNCYELRSFAIQKINEEITNAHTPLLSPVESILLGRKYYVGNWVLRGYIALIRRQNVISEQESLEIGPLEAFRLMSIRETKRWVANIEDEVTNRFKDELEMIAANAEVNTPSESDGE